MVRLGVYSRAALPRGWGRQVHLPAIPSPALSLLGRTARSLSLSLLPQAFELDLLGVKPDTQVPEFLGKVLNTLANDRNTKCVLSTPPRPSSRR